MKPGRQREQGFLLITVIVVLGVLATMALTLSANTAIDNALIVNQGEGETLNYVAESGMEHAKWQLAQNMTCSAYSDLPVTPFDQGSYAATVTPTSNSPVSISAVGTLADGASRTLILNDVTVYDRGTPVTAILMPGAEGKDTFVEGQSGHTSHNKGSDNHLKVSSKTGQEYRTLIEFDLSTLPPTALIQTATLKFELDTVGSSDVVEAHPLLRPWTESGVNWDTYDGTHAWTTPGGDYDAAIAGSFVTDSPGPKSMDISGIAKAWVDGSQANFGLILLSATSPGGNENTFDSSDKGGSTRPVLQLTYVCECGAVCTGMASGNTVILSTENQAGLGGLTFENTDLANYDATSDTATLFMDGALTTLNEAINAVHLLENGHIVLSARHATTLGGLSFNDEDLVEYDPATDTATMYLDGSQHFEDNEDIISLHILNDGNLVLSTFSNASLGGLSFSNRDLVEYDPVLRTASIFFDGDAAGLTENIGAVHVLESGQIILGVWGDTTLGGISLTAADLVQYDLATDSATLYFPGTALFSTSNEEIASVHIYGDFGPPAISTLKVLFVVANSGSLTSDEAARKALMESWGYVVELIDDSDSQASFDNAATTNDVVYVGQEIVSGEIGNKLTNLAIGVVDEEQQLYDEIGFGDSYTSDHSMRDIDIVDNAHEITSVFATGNLSVTSSDQSMHYLSGGLSSDLTVLAVYPSSSYPILAVLDVGDTLYGGGNAAGRRVWLPWGGNIFQFSGLNADGHQLMRRAIEWAADGASASASGLIAHWKLDDGSGTAAIDSEGGHTGILANGPTWSSSGNVDGALTFDGSDDYVRVSDSSDFHLAEGTIQAWIKADTTGAEQYLFQKDGSDKIFVRVKDGEIAYETSGDNISGSIQANQWYLVTVMFGSDGMKLYLNDNLVASSSKTDTIVNNNADIYFGADSSGDKAFDGMIDDVRVYDRALSATEIADLFAGGGGGGGSPSNSFRDEFNTDSSFSGDDGTLSWSTDWLEIGESNGAGSGDLRTWDDVSQYQLRIRDSDNGGEGVEREADLSGCASATLSFDYRRQGLDSSNDYVTVDVSSNGGGSWTELDRLQGSATDPAYQIASYDISAHQATNTRIRFLGSPTLGGSDTVYFDNIEIACP